MSQVGKTKNKSDEKLKKEQEKAEKATSANDPDVEDPDMIDKDQDISDKDPAPSDPPPANDPPKDPPKTKVKLDDKAATITQFEMETYERIRVQGKTNMFDASRVIQLSGNHLTKEKLVIIMEHYDKLMKKYKIERG